jgi:hypothetical protein
MVDIVYIVEYIYEFFSFKNSAFFCQALNLFDQLGPLEVYFSTL